MGEQLELEIQAGYLGPVVSPNPMIAIHGPGPEGATCGRCAHLVGWARSRTYWKCGKRGDLTHGRKTDQRKGWPTRESHRSRTTASSPIGMR